MASITWELKQQLRTCKVDGVNALFHTWVHWEKGVVGLVELEDGTMQRRAPEFIRFTDSPHREYCFEEAERKED